MELVILSITDEDIREWADDERWRELQERGLVEPVMHLARKYMWNAIDCGNMWGDCICEAVDATLRRG